MAVSKAPTSSSVEQTDVIITGAGGGEMPKAAYRGGALIGYNSSNDRPPERIPVKFIDWPFLEDDPDFERHLNAVKRENPKYAVAPDIQTPDDLLPVLSKADTLANHAEIVIVVPKGVKPDKIPSRFRVGIPAQEEFGGVPWPIWEYRNCRSCHILGGSPNIQFELENYVNVHSVDSASPLKGASYGDVWDGVWSEGGHNYYDRIERSMNNILREWNPNVNEARVNAARRSIKQPDSCPLPKRRKAKPPTRQEMCIAPDEEKPFPGREFFERRDTIDYSDYEKM
jgi:hypothetical protein